MANRPERPFKKLIKANLGRKVKLLIKREGKVREIEFVIPTEIPQGSIECEG